MERHDEIRCYEAAIFKDSKIELYLALKRNRGLCMKSVFWWFTPYLASISDQVTHGHVSFGQNKESSV